MGSLSEDKHIWEGYVEKSLYNLSRIAKSVSTNHFR